MEVLEISRLLRPIGTPVQVYKVLAYGYCSKCREAFPMLVFVAMWMIYSGSPSWRQVSISTLCYLSAGVIISASLSFRYYGKEPMYDSVLPPSAVLSPPLPWYTNVLFYVAHQQSEHGTMGFVTAFIGMIPNLISLTSLPMLLSLLLSIIKLTLFQLPSLDSLSITLIFSHQFPLLDLPMTLWRAVGFHILYFRLTPSSWLKRAPLLLIVVSLFVFSRIFFSYPTHEASAQSHVLSHFRDSLTSLPPNSTIISLDRFTSALLAMENRRYGLPYRFFPFSVQTLGEAEVNRSISQITSSYDSLGPFFVFSTLHPSTLIERFAALSNFFFIPEMYGYRLDVNPPHIPALLNSSFNLPLKAGFGGLQKGSWEAEVVERYFSLRFSLLQIIYSPPENPFSTGIDAKCSPASFETLRNLYKPFLLLYRHVDVAGPRYLPALRNHLYIAIQALRESKPPTFQTGEHRSPNEQLIVKSEEELADDRNRALEMIERELEIYDLWKRYSPHLRSTSDEAPASSEYQAFREVLKELIPHNPVSKRAQILREAAEARTASLKREKRERKDSVW